MQLISDTEPRFLNSQCPFHTQHSTGRWSGGQSVPVKILRTSQTLQPGQNKSEYTARSQVSKLGWAWRDIGRRTQENLRIIHSHPPEAGLEVLGKLLRLKPDQRNAVFEVGP